MNEHEVIEAIKTLRKFGCETISIEAKRAKGNFPNCLDTLSSFSNKYGGMIIFGLNEERGFVAEGVYNVKLLQNKLTEVAKKKMKPSVSLDILPMKFENVIIVAAKIYELPQNQKPCYVISEGINRGSYTRIGESDSRMNDYEIYELQSYRLNIQEDKRPIAQAYLEEMNETEIDKYMNKIKQDKPKFSQSSDSRFLELSGITIRGVPTLAGIMVFGKYPQAYCPQLFVACSAIPGIELGDVGEMGQRFDDNERIEGTIEEMLAGTLRFLRRNMKTRIVIRNGRRFDVTEYPMDALREAVANALVHRDYSRYSERIYIQVCVYRDRIEIINPGALYGQNRLEKLGTATTMETRNPNIVKLLEEKDPFVGSEKAIENRHTGIKTMRLKMKEYGLNPPEFIEDRGAFKVVFRNEPVLNRIKKLEDNVDGITSDVVNAKSDVVNAKSDADATISDADNAKNGVAIEEYSGNVKNERMRKRLKQVDAHRLILEVCKNPKSAKEIAELLNINSKDYLVRRYLKPMIADGRLKMTHPDKAHSRNQKYYSE